VKILLVEDDASCRTATEIVLKYLGYSAQGVASAEEALTCFDRSVHRVVLTDVHLPDRSGEELAAELKRRSPTTPVIIYTGSVEVDIEHMDALLSKPASIESFRKTLSRLASDSSPLEKAKAPTLPPRFQKPWPQGA
jgi:DNA-binding NtrC family response regulator